MALARESLRLGYIPHVDLYAYTPTLKTSIHHEWGAGFIAYFLATRFGAAGIVTLKLVLAFALAAVCVLCARARGARFPLLVLLAAPAILMVGNGFAPVRAQMYSFALTALLFYWLRCDERGSRAWILPWLVVFCLWVNLHGGFVVGIAFLFLHWVEQVLRRRPHWHLAATLSAMTGLVAVNPYGYEYYRYLWTALAMKRPDIPEWRTLWQSGDPVYLSVFACSVLLLAYCIVKLPLRDLPGLGILLAAAAGTFLHVRMIPFLAVALFCYLPGYMQRTPLSRWIEAKLFTPSPGRIALWGAPAAFFLLLAFTVQFWRLDVPGQPSSNSSLQTTFPVGPVKYLEAAGFSGNLMAPFEQGAYLSWKMYPRVRVFFDSRYEGAYPDWLVKRAFQFYRAEPGWKDTLAAYPTDMLLIRTGQPIRQVIAQVPWNKVYSDRGFEMYARPGLQLHAVDWRSRTFEDVFP